MTVYNILITDGSGSMGSLASDVRGGHNAYLDKVSASALESGEGVRVTLAIFNTSVDIIDNNVPIDLATRLDYHNYIPNGGTALLDAIGNTLATFRASATLKPNDKVFVYIQTDGQENSSKEFTKAAVAAAIAELEAQEWAFVFSGTGPDGWADRGTVGLAHASTMNANTGDGILRSYTGRSDAVTDYLETTEAERATFTSANVSARIQDTIDQPEGDTSA